MELTFGSRLKHAFNAFMNKDPTIRYHDTGPGYSYRPDRPRLSRGNERSIVTAVFNRIALDVASLDIIHCKVDDNGRFLSNIDSTLNSCLNLEANLDQTGRAFIQDIVMSMFDEGCIAIVPIDTNIEPTISGSYDILSMRTGKIIEWYSQEVKVRVYNERTGRREDIILPKRTVAIVENPFFAVINEPNSTMQRLMRKLSLLDIVDEESSAGKLDLIIQLPYTIKSETRRTQAENRRKDIEMQLKDTKYGIAYTDATEKITQLNRPLENNLMKQIEYLTNMLFSQLGMTQSILDGTADEQTLLNYHSRTIEPIISAIVDEMKRKFLTKTARTQNQTISFFRDPFKLVPVNNIADIADKFTRNEIMTSNEIRQVIGMKPSDDPKADELRNSNLNHPDEGKENQVGQSYQENPSYQEPDTTGYDTAIENIAELDAQIEALESILPKGDDLKHYASPYYDPVKAHEYYMKTRELKGRTSTATLNDDGKAAAKYVKEQLTAERKSKVEDHSNKTQDEIDAKRDEMQTVIDAKREKMLAEINSKKEKMLAEIDAKREKLLADVESHTTQTKSKIEKLREELNNMSMTEWNEKAERIQSEINELKESNNTIREKLQETYSAESATLRNKHANEKASLQNEHANEKASLQNKNAEERSNLRSEHKAETSRLKDEYDEKYVSELDKIKSESKYLKATKKKS